jgi:hypothetical protein
MSPCELKARTFIYLAKTFISDAVNIITPSWFAVVAPMLSRNQRFRKPPVVDVDLVISFYSDLYFI